MTTTIAKTIGTGGDYSTLQAWEDACPADLTAVDQIWRGECLNQEFVVSATALNASGVVASVTNYMELTTAAGCSFQDHASKSTNPLRYNAAAGAAIRNTSGYSFGIRIDTQYFRLSNLQIKAGSQSTAVMAGEFGSGAYATIKNCIIESDGGNSAVFYGNHATLINSVVISLGGSKLAYIGISGSWYNSTLVHLGASTASPINTSYPSGTIRNCYIGGNITALPTLGSVVQNCSTSLGSPPSGFTTAAMSTANFENVTAGTHDFRLKSGSALINIGTDDSTNAANDILGTARTAGAYDIGAHEYAAGGGGADATAPGGTGTSTGSGSGGTATGGSAGTGSFTFPVGENNTHSGPMDSVAVNWAWHSGGAVGAASVITNGSGTMTTGGMTISGLPTGAGYGVLRSSDGTVVGYREGTVS